MSASAANARDRRHSTTPKTLLYKTKTLCYKKCALGMYGAGGFMNRNAR